MITHQKDERITALKHFTLIMLVILGAFVWLWTHTDRPLTPRELWNLESLGLELNR